MATVRLHPEVATVVTLTWDQPFDADDAWVSWTVDGREFTTPHGPRAAGTQSEVLLGTPAETPVAPLLYWTTAGEAHTEPLPEITTGSLPEHLVVPERVAHEPDRVRPEPWLLTSVDVGDAWFFGPWFTVILDLEGRIVWYRETSENRMSWQVKASQLGGYLTIDESNTYDGPRGTITRTTLDGRQTEVTELRDLFMVYDELADGSYLYSEGETEDFWLTRHHPDGTAERIWACRPWMAAWRDQYWSCAANTVTYSPERGSVLYSMFLTDTVVEIELETGEMLAEYGRYPGGFDFDPVDTTFDHQHLPSWTTEGTLLVQTDSLLQPGQWAREYAVDAEDGTLREVYSLQSPYHAMYAGQPIRLPSGNILWQHGSAGAIDEHTREGELVWGIDWDGHLTGNITPIPDLYALNTGW